MSYLEWKLNQELNGRSTFEKDEKFREEYKTYLKQDIPAHVIPLLYAQAKLIRATHKFKEDTYDDALAYIVQSHDMHKEKSEEIDTDELLGMETKPGTKW